VYLEINNACLKIKIKKMLKINNININLKKCTQQQENLHLCIADRTVTTDWKYFSYHLHTDIFCVT